MSFSGTPLGQGRRLDHGTFLNKPPSNGNRPPSPNRLIPSYAYGAPTLGSRSPPKPSSPVRNHNTSIDDDDHNDSALAQFARFKQHEQGSLSSRPGGPKIITSPPNTEKWNVKDTSVNIASAFYQAATDMNPGNNPNNSWASGSTRPNAVPRSTSVEYEMESQAAMKRLQAPQNRPRNTVNRKPVSKTSSLRHVPDSEEEERPAQNGRGKSPFLDLVDSARKVIAPAAFYLQRTTGTGDVSTETPANPKDSSYDYVAEEQEYQMSQNSRRTSNATHKRNRMSTDNKAYRPEQSESSDEDFEEDGKTKRRKKKKKKEALGGPLSSLPVINADKRKKRRSKANKGASGTIDEDDDSESEDQVTDRQSAHRGSIPPPPIRQRSIPRASIPPEPHDYDPNTSLDAEQGLDSIPEVEEDELNDLHHDYTQQRSAPRPTSRLGAPLGNAVNFMGRLFRGILMFMLHVLTTLLYFCGQIFGTITNIVFQRPIDWASGAGGRYLVKCLLLGIIISAVYMLRGSLVRYLPSLSTGPYRAPDAPVANMGDFAARLQRIENVLAGISQDIEKGRTRAEIEAKSHSDMVGRLGALEGKVMVEGRRAAEAEVQFRNVAKDGLKLVKQEMEALQAQVHQHQQHQQPPVKVESRTVDEEARTRVKVLEETVRSVEGGVKEALELSKKAGSGVSSAGAAWWNKLASGNAAKSGLTIKASDGQDITALIDLLVDSAMSAYSKDGIGKPDFAHNSGGARVIPRLTSPTLEIQPPTVRGHLVGLLTGSGFAVGRPPITAMHHELHNGNCWPFAGSEGHLGVVLAAPTYISEITIDHVAKEVAFDMRSAPREMEVWAMVEGKDNIAKVKEWVAEKTRRRQEAEERGEVELEEEPEYPQFLPKSPPYIRIANFSYNIHAPKHIQTFPVSQEIKDLGVDFGIVVLRIKSNWGRDEYTCLYRMRVHGQKMGETPLPYPEELS